jgi:hypothetical protein
MPCVHSSPEAARGEDAVTISKDDDLDDGAWAGEYTDPVPPGAGPLLLLAALLLTAWLFEWPWWLTLASIAGLVAVLVILFGGDRT